mmetsp:Transcript_22907/g.66652  ORF Transcript_22907/g.66652 Transcript_22907/m.66652 type:complete len:391 (+) Transcript_22907:3893-5065(+)
MRSWFSTTRSGLRQSSSSTRTSSRNSPRRPPALRSAWTRICESVPMLLSPPRLKATPRAGTYRPHQLRSSRPQPSPPPTSNQRLHQRQLPSRGTRLTKGRFLSATRPSCGSSTSWTRGSTTSFGPWSGALSASVSRSNGSGQPQPRPPWTRGSSSCPSLGSRRCPRTTTGQWSYASARPRSTTYWTCPGTPGSISGTARPGSACSRPRLPPSPTSRGGSCAAPATQALRWAPPRPWTPPAGSTSTSAPATTTRLGRTLCSSSRPLPAPWLPSRRPSSAASTPPQSAPARTTSTTFSPAPRPAEGSSRRRARWSSSCTASQRSSSRPSSILTTLRGGPTRLSPWSRPSPTVTRPCGSTSWPRTWSAGWCTPCSVPRRPPQSGPFASATGPE